MKFATALVIATVLYSNFALGADPLEKRPNIVLLFIDDWAWNGSPVPMDDAMANSRMPVLQMPNVERLAREGMKFRNAYASPQCSPSRVCVQTGQSSPRNGFTVYMNDRGQEYYDEKGFPGFPVVPCVSDMTIDQDAVTIPEVLKPLGYVSAHIGKWHMRGDPGDEGYVLHDGDTNNNPGNTLPDDAKQRLPDDLTDPKLMFSVTQKAIGFMDDQVKAGKPFYLQISHYAMHEGRECLPATREKYARHPAVQAYYKKNGTTAEKVNRKSDPAIWLGMGEDLDGRIGAVLDRIKELGIEDNTYVVMVSDNGYRHSFLPGLKQPHHGAKWWVWQGGIRVPMIVKGPGIQAGSTVRQATSSTTTSCRPSSIGRAAIRRHSRTSMGSASPPYMAARNRATRSSIATFTSTTRTIGPACRIPRWSPGSRKLMHFYERPDVPMLFDLSKDMGEVHNIAKTHPEEHNQLYDEMMGYFEKCRGSHSEAQSMTTTRTSTGRPRNTRSAWHWGPFEGSRPLEDDEK